MSAAVMSAVQPIYHGDKGVNKEGKCHVKMETFKAFESYTALLLVLSTRGLTKLQKNESFLVC